MSKTIKELIVISIAFILILIGMSTIIEATDTQFCLTEKELVVSLNSTRSLWYDNKPEGTKVTWESSNPSVATVDEYGSIKALQIGTTTITATAGEQSDECKITVAYNNIRIGAYEYSTVTSVDLVLGEHPNEQLTVTVEDGKFEKVEDAKVTWTTSDSKVVTVDDRGKIKGISAGKATITAKAAGVSATCEVNVYAAPKFTDFSKAKYELLFDVETDLKISGIRPKDKGHTYYYIITSDNKKPTISINKSGSLDLEKTKEANNLIINIEKNYIYDYDLDRFVELNQDMYLWIIEEVKLDGTYYEEQSYVSYAIKYVVEGEKLIKPNLPQLNLILKTFNIASYENKNNSEEYKYTYINFIYPTDVENRKFKLKIGKVTDNSILQKIQKNDYSGITELLKYAKSNKAIYQADLKTTSQAYFSSKDILFDGRKLLNHKAYYYIYVEFDDENGKYRPIEGVTLAQAWIYNESKNWDLYAYTAKNFEWNNLSGSYEEDVKKPEEIKKEEPKKENTKKDNTTAKQNLPDTGIRNLLIISILVLTISIIFSKVKKDKYKQI